MARSTYIYLVIQPLGEDYLPVAAFTVKRELAAVDQAPALGTAGDPGLLADARQPRQGPPTSDLDATLTRREP